MSYRSELGRVRGLGSAKSGSGLWLAQKISSVILAVLFLWFAFSFALLIKADYQTAVIWMATPFNTVLLITFIVVSIYHAILGLQIVIEDYVAKVCQRIALIYLVKVGLTIIGLALVLAILRIVITFNTMMTIPTIWG